MGLGLGLGLGLGPGLAVQVVCLGRVSYSNSGLEHGLDYLGLGA